MKNFDPSKNDPTPLQKKILEIFSTIYKQVRLIVQNGN